MEHDETRLKPGTRCVHAGEPETAWPVTPIHLVSGFLMDSVEDLESRVQAGRFDAFYTRYGNPTLKAVQEKVASLEGGEAALVFSSGMAAIAAATLGHLRSGDELVSVADVYGGTHALFHRLLPRWGITVSLVPTSDTAAIARALERRPRALYLESPTNPLLNIVDIAELSDLAHAKGALVLVDSTFGTPMNQQPLALGADLVIHSATKYLGGHTDLLAGAVTGSRKHIKPLVDVLRFMGGVLDPHAAWLLQRGMKTLEIRMERINATALRIARYLQSHTGIQSVIYPGLPEHPGHEIARRQMSGFGGIVTLRLGGDEAATRRFVDGLEIFSLVPTLGGVESLVTIPALTSHASIPRPEREAAGITDTLVRLSLGIEDPADLEADLDRALQGAVDRGR